MGEELKVSVTITNTGKMRAKETVQLYFRDMVGSLTRPVKELLRFEKVALEPGESKEITFTFTTEDLSFYGPDKKWLTETGDFKLWVAKNALDVSQELNFTIN